MANFANIATSVNGRNTGAWRGDDDFERRQHGNMALNWHKTAGMRDAGAACQFRHLAAGMREAAAEMAKKSIEC